LTEVMCADDDGADYGVTVCQLKPCQK
jgi:hypothetical protein